MTPKPPIFSAQGGYMSKNFDSLISKVKEIPMKTVAIACAQDVPVLEAAKAAREQKIANSILVGDEEKIREIAASIGMDLTGFEIIDRKDMMESALTAVKLVHEGKADIYMKGLIDSKSYLKGLLDKEVGLRNPDVKTLSHVCVFEVPGIDRLLFLTDVAFLPYPTLEQKADIINNTVKICNACGIYNPKVAPLATVEVVNEKMPCTVEAAELTRMNEEGIIKDCIVDGPLSMDIAIEPEAAVHKGATDRKIQGDADILLFPDIHAGNLVYKMMVHCIPGIRNGNVLTGTSAPAILTSRSDSMDVKLNSIALACLVAESMKK